METEDVKDELIQTAERVGVKEDIRFIFIYGSFLDRDDYRDIDVAISFYGEGFNELNRLYGSLPEIYELHDFEELPVRVRKEVLGGKLVYSKDKSVYDRALETLREYESFEPLYRMATGKT